MISLEKFTRLECAPGYAIAGAGVLLSEVHAAAQRSGQFYPPDPDRDLGLHRRNHRHQRQRLAQLSIRRHAPLDGEAARGSGGWQRAPIRARRGDRFRPRSIPLPHVTKNTAGYLLRPGMDWIDLFAGSEGTLGVITEAHLKLLPAPKAILGGVVFFPDDDAAIDAVEVWRETASPRMLEYLDGASLDLLRTRFAEIPPRAHARRFCSSRSSRAKTIPKWTHGPIAWKRRVR